MCDANVMILLVLTSTYSHEHYLSLFHNILNGHFNRNIPS